jgi:peptide chain release factor 1
MTQQTIDKVRQMETRLDEVEKMLSQPDVVRDRKKFTDLTREHSDLKDIVQTSHQLESVRKQLEEARQMLHDPEMAQLAKEEVHSLESEEEKLDHQLNDLLIPKDPDDDRNTIVEIRAGTGGDEAALFGAELFRMYCRYAEGQGWKIELMDSHPTEIGGIKEVTFSVQGKGAFGHLKFESGVHRVQRVPRTEAGGRIHTSAVSVAVLPEAEKVDVDIDEEKDIRVDRFCSSGPGGQSVNTTYSAIRVTHLPTGLVVSCQDEKSQIKNLARAMKVLRSRLLDLRRREQEEARQQQRRSMVGSGDRSAKIRTYNFPQSRVTDHRIGLTVHNLESILEGQLDDVIDALRREERMERLQAVNQV